MAKSEDAALRVVPLPLNNNLVNVTLYKASLNITD